MAQIKFKVEDGLLVRGQANVTGNTVIVGSLTLGDGGRGEILNPVIVHGDLTPNTNDTHLLGNTTNRWTLVNAVGGNFSDEIEVTNISNLYGGAYLESNISFNTNNHTVGNTVAAPILHSTNTFVYNTLSVGPSVGNPYLLANSSTIILQSNVDIKDASLSIGNNFSNLFTARNTSFPISYVAGSPTVVNEVATTNNYRMIKYFITASVNYDGINEAIQTSEVTLLINGDNTSISEFNMMTNPSNINPIIGYNVARATGLVRLVAYATSAVTNPAQPAFNISFARLATK